MREQIKEQNKIVSNAILILIASLFAILLLANCGSNRKAVKQSEIKIDSVFVKQIERVEVITKDTIITTQLDSVLILDTLFLPTDCPTVSKKEIVAISKSGNTKATVRFKNGVLAVRCDSDSLKILVTNLRKIVSYKENELSKAKLNVQTKEVPVEVVKEIYKYPWWWWICIVYTVSSLLYIFRNPIISIIKRFK